MEIALRPYRIVFNSFHYISMPCANFLYHPKKHRGTVKVFNSLYIPFSVLNSLNKSFYIRNTLFLSKSRKRFYNHIQLYSLKKGAPQKNRPEIG